MENVVLNFSGDKWMRQRFLRGHAFVRTQRQALVKKINKCQYQPSFLFCNSTGGCRHYTGLDISGRFNKRQFLCKFLKRKRRVKCCCHERHISMLCTLFVKRSISTEIKLFSSSKCCAPNCPFFIIRLGSLPFTSMMCFSI